MRLAWELLINAVEVFLIYDFLVRYFGYRAEGAAKYAGTILIAGAAFSVISVVSYAVPFEMFSTVAVAVINIIFCSCLLKGHIFEKVFISVFIMAAVNMIAVGTALVFSHIQSTEVFYLFARLDPIRMAAMVTTKVILFAVTRLILRLRFRSELSAQEFFILLLLPSFSLAAAAVLMPAALEHPEIQNTVLIAVAIIAAMNVLIYILFLRFSRLSRIRQDYALLNLQYAGEKKRMEEVRRLYEEIRSARHDLKNHFVCIDLLAKQEKYEEIRDYIRKFSQEAQNPDGAVLFTGNDTLDAILNTKFSFAEQKGIRCAAEVNCAQLPLAQGDISVLMGNLLDNACEAAGRAPEKKISVRILRQGNYVSICVENTVEAPVLAKNPGLETTKEDRSLHGLGTKNIRKIVEKYGGMMEYREEGKLFICDILIPFDTSYGV